MDPNQNNSGAAAKATIPASPLQQVEPTPTSPPPAPPITKSGKSKHLILLLLIFFPPLAWYYMWKEDKYHNWFASVLIVDGLILLATSIMLFAAVYPPIIQLYTSLLLPRPVFYEVIPYAFIGIGAIEVIYGLLLRLRTNHHHILSKKLLILAVLLLSIHFIGLPLSQIASYYSVLSSVYSLNIYDYNSRKAQQITPQPTTNPTANWKSFKNTTLGFELKYPPDYIIIRNTNSSFQLGTDKLGSDNISISNENGSEFIKLNTLKSCKKIAEEIEQKSLTDRPPCLDEGKKFGQAEDITNTKIGNTDAISFYLTSTGRGITSRIIQSKTNQILQLSISQFSTTKNKTDQILTTFKFLDSPTISPTCVPRPACLDASPRCLIPETSDICPKATPTPNQVACTMDAKLCPDGSSVSRTSPNCEFAACP